MRRNGLPAEYVRWRALTCRAEASSQRALCLSRALRVKEEGLGGRRLQCQRLRGCAAGGGEQDGVRLIQKPFFDDAGRDGGGAATSLSRPEHQTAATSIGAKVPLAVALAVHAVLEGAHAPNLPLASFTLAFAKQEKHVVDRPCLGGILRRGRGRHDAQLVRCLDNCSGNSRTQRSRGSRSGLGLCSSQGGTLAGAGMDVAVLHNDPWLHSHETAGGVRVGWLRPVAL